MSQTDDELEDEEAKSVDKSAKKPYWMEGAEELGEDFLFDEDEENEEDWPEDEDPYWMEGAEKDVVAHAEVDKTDKTGWGIACALFAGLAGLIFGCMLYEDKPKERKSFVRAFWWTFLVFYALIIFIVVMALTA